MGAVIDTLELTRKIPLQHELTSRFGIMHPQIISQNQQYTVFKIANRSKQIPITTSVRNSDKTANNKSFIEVTNKQMNRGQKSTANQKNSKYVMRNVTLSPVVGQTVLSSLQKLNIIHNNIIQQKKKKKTKICDLLDYSKQQNIFACGSQIHLNLIFQYWGQYTLAQQVKLRSEQLQINKQEPSNRQKKLCEFQYQLSQIHIFIKFLLQVADQLLNYVSIQGHQHTLFPKISLQDVIICQQMSKQSSKTKTNLKYRNPIESTHCYDRENLFSTNNIEYLNKSPQSHLLSNIGICILSICLLEDCNMSCCSNGNICISAIEEKVQQVYRTYSANNQQNIVKQLCILIQLFSFQIVADFPISIQQAKSHLNKYCLEIQKTKLKLNNDCNKSNVFTSDLQTSCTLNVLEKKTSSQSKQNTKIANACSQSFPCIPEQNQIKTQRNIKATRNCSISSKIRKQWSAKRSSNQKVQIKDSIQKKQKILIKQFRPALKAIQCNDFIFKCEQIDNKWKETDSIFKNMPQFQRCDSSIFHLMSGRRPSQIQMKFSNIQNDIRLTKR